ncbi:MAG: hypothetical protein EBQ56_03860 [Proteobacteria bacterium]|nr:hypothetical protein [Chloroflexota bacterium]NBY46904.1 hypothetical protein [Pseudomonadota bacterium]
MQSGCMPPIWKAGHDNPADCCVTLPQRFDGDFDLTVQNLTAIFEDFTEARDVWRSARRRMETVRRNADPDWAAVRPEASGHADATVRVLRSAMFLGIAAREAEQRLVDAGADLTHMGDPRVKWFTVASAAIVGALQEFRAERTAVRGGRR